MDCAILISSLSPDRALCTERSHGNEEHKSAEGHKYLHGCIPLSKMLDWALGEFRSRDGIVVRMVPEEDWSVRPFRIAGSAPCGSSRPPEYKNPSRAT